MRKFKLISNLFLAFLFVLTLSFSQVASANMKTQDTASSTYQTTPNNSLISTVSQGVYSSGPSIGIDAITTEYYPGTSVAIRAGDVLVSNNTSSNGLTGHAGIVVNDQGSVATINGYNKFLTLEGITTWKSKNTNTKVMRYSNSGAATQAGNWAKSYINNYKSQVTYGLINTIGVYEKETYCSKIVWDAYYFGANISIDGHTPFWNGIYGPYHLLNEANFRQVASWGNNF
ncbi:hypothetical protein [Paenibacillus campi]|uniref:hypothetical protein n=1 Tax=Paenibacillus campi TaxID=3106031 RepID=UPI002AFDF2C4|nr:hypothetical protein [Paenibacillus sp. SGZ-1009]